MTTPSLGDLRSLYYGGGSAAEYAYLKDAASKGITAASVSLLSQVATPVVPRVGDYFFTTHFARSTAATTLNRLMYIPLSVPVRMRLDTIGAELTAVAVTSVLRLGLYNCGPDGWPKNLLVDAGTLDGTAVTGPKNLPIDITLEPGNYWAAAVGQGATGNATWRTGNTGPSIPNPAGMASLGFMYNCLIENGVAAGLPAVATPAQPNAFPVVVQVRRAA